LSISGTDTRSKARREKSALARNLALEGKWKEAIEVNKSLIEENQRDVDAFNRLGKAYFELRRYRSAYEAYSSALEVDPANIISRRNLERLEPLRDVEEEDEDAGSRPPARFNIFIEEAGKTFVDEVVEPAPSAVLMTLSSGEQLDIVIDGTTVSLVDDKGEYIGKLEPRIARRLINLIEIGNEYAVYVTANAGDSVRVIIREMNRSPEMGDRLSFPHQGKVAVPRSFLRDSRLFRSDESSLLLDEEELEDVEDPDEAFDATDAEDLDDDDTEFIDESVVVATDDEDDDI
jgi:tetratricopeptide (TPR) repeat protein